MKTKFTVRVDSEWLEAAKKYAARHDITLTRLVGEYLRALSKEAYTQTPVLENMTGSLKTDTAIEDYHAYLDEKYGTR